MKIPARARRCFQDDFTFHPGAKYLSVLDDNLRRYDYCAKCAEKVSPVGQFWWGTVPDKEIKRPDQDEVLLEKLRLLVDKQPSLAYLLALYMQRAGLLCRRSKQLFEVPYSGEVFRVQEAAINERDRSSFTQMIHNHVTSS